MKLNSSPQLTVRVLAALPDKDDRTAIGSIFAHSNWTIGFAENYEEVSSALAKTSFGVVIVEAYFTGGRNWKNVLDLTQAMPAPIPVIVTDRVADERLWAEVLNLGAYDLLLKPFDPTEVYRIVSSAWLSWRVKHEPFAPGDGKAAAMHRSWSRVAS
jgi:DNA-binding NtrC family response regulator